MERTEFGCIGYHIGSLVDTLHDFGMRSRPGCAVVNRLGKWDEAEYVSVLL